MGDLAIRVEGLGKRYKVGQRVSYHRFTEAITGFFTSPFRKRNNPEGDGHFWALKDVAFDVKKGEVLGIIGRNGAGKSTLLKILSRVTEMTEGAVDIYGRIGSLLEVGTGFHPELTGRENIYLNGAILGMKRPEIRRKFDEIVAFSEVERFLDMPVKHYSSGMYMRLAFAVAAHLQPHILLVDEVLAVGDAAFQKKCMGRMSEEAKGGRTIIFVSHNLGAIAALCARSLLLKNGRVAAISETGDIISRYLLENTLSESGEVVLTDTREAELAFTRVRVTNANGGASGMIDVTEPFTIVLEFTVQKTVSEVEISVCLKNSRGINVLFSSLSESYGGQQLSFTPGRYTTAMRVNGNFLIPDTYFLRISAHHRNVRDIALHEDLLALTIVETGSAMAPYGRAASQWSCVLGGTQWQLDQLAMAQTGQRPAAHGGVANGIIG